MNSSDKNKNIHISDKELDRDIVNLNLPDTHLELVDSVDDLDFYDDDMKDWLKNGEKKNTKDVKK